MRVRGAHLAVFLFLGTSFAADAALASTPKPVHPARVFAGDALKLVIAHQWDDFVRVCDPDHRKVQLKQMKMAKAQYIGEMLGLFRAGNSIGGKNAPTLTDLRRIKKITLGKMRRAGASYMFVGVVTLRSGKKLTLHLMVHRVKGRLFLTGAVG